MGSRGVYNQCRNVGLVGLYSLAVGVVNLLLSLASVSELPEGIRVEGAIVSIIAITLAICDAVETYVVLRHVQGVAGRFCTRATRVLSCSRCWRAWYPPDEPIGGLSAPRSHRVELGVALAGPEAPETVNDFPMLRSKRIHQPR